MNIRGTRVCEYPGHKGVLISGDAYPGFEGMHIRVRGPVCISGIRE